MTLTLDITAKATHEIEYAMTRILLARDPALRFFSTLGLRLRRVPTRLVPTMGTDGRFLFYNPEFTLSLTPPERLGVLVHEIVHCMKKDFSTARRGDRDPEIWNDAADLSDNQIVEAAGCELPATALRVGFGPYAHLAPNMATEEYYRLLIENASQSPKPKPSSSGSGAEAGPQGGVDGVPSDPAGTGSVFSPRIGKQIAEREGVRTGTEAKDGADGSPADERRLEREWQNAIAQAAQIARSRGDLPVEIEDLVGKVLAPKTDWRAYLREFVRARARNDYSWVRPNRRYLSRGLVLPSVHSESIGDLVVGLDESASVESDEFAAFSSELTDGVLAAYDCRALILHHDSVVHRAEIWTPEDGPFTVRRVAHGGTDHRPVFEEIEKQGFDPACAIMFTDLETRFPSVEPDYPVLWAVSGHRTRRPWGDLLKVEV